MSRRRAAARDTSDLDPRETSMSNHRVDRRSFLCAAVALALGAALAGPSAFAAGDGRLTTHVLDTYTGRPAAGVRIDFGVVDGDSFRVLKTVETNVDGRTDKPLLAGETMAVGRYQIVFHIGDYYSKLGVALPDPVFLDNVPVQFAISDATAHYHVPLLATPWSYSTYRGS